MTDRKMPEIYTRAMDVLWEHLSGDELVKLHETMDEDPTNDLFWLLSERLFKTRPDLFVSGPWADDEYDKRCDEEYRKGLIGTDPNEEKASDDDATEDDRG